MARRPTTIAAALLLGAAIQLPAVQAASAQVRAAMEAVEAVESALGYGRAVRAYGRTSESFSKAYDLAPRYGERFVWGAGAAGAFSSNRRNPGASSAMENPALEDIRKKNCADEMTARLLVPGTCDGLPKPLSERESLAAIERAVKAEMGDGRAVLAPVEPQPAPFTVGVNVRDIEDVCDDSASGSVRDRASRSLFRALLKTASRRIAPFDAEDATQGTLSKLLHHCKQVLAYSNPVRGLYGILRFEVVDIYRKKMRSDSLEDQPDNVDLSVDPNDAYEKADVRRRLYANLTPRQQEVLEGIYADMSGPEIAKSLGISAYRVKEIRGAISKKLTCLSCAVP